jgi:hypothetical protein
MGFASGCLFMIKNKKINKESAFITILIVFITSYSLAFKDTSSEVNEAAEKFAAEGLFGSFIYRYGTDLFRPDGYVTRDNLILILREYHVLTQKLYKQNMEMLAKINKLKKNENLSSDNIDRILQNSQIFQAINHNFNEVLKTGNSNAELSELKKQIKSLTEKFQEIYIRNEPTLISNEEPVKNADNLQNEVNKLNKNIKDLWRLYTGIMKYMASLNISLEEQKLADLKKDNEILNEKYISQTEFNKIKDEIKNLNKKMEYLLNLYSEKNIDKGRK